MVSTYITALYVVQRISGLIYLNFEEKQTDVNIAFHLYDDVIHKRCEQVILVSNDSDLLPAL